jgi:hypothetical protein
MGANALEENLACRGFMEEQHGHQYPIDELVMRFQNSKFGIPLLGNKHPRTTIRNTGAIEKKDSNQSYAIHLYN